MNRTAVIASACWLTSLLGAGWVGRTWFPAAPGTGESAEGIHSKTHAGRTAGHTAAPRAGGSAAGGAAADGKTAGDRWGRLWTDPKIAAGDRLDGVLALEDPVEKMEAFLALMHSLGGTEDFAEAAGKLMEDFNPRSRGRELSMLMTEWAKRDPRAAADHAGKLGNWTGRYAAYSVLQQWAKDDPDAAKGWAIEAGKDLSKDEGNWYMVGVIAGLSRTDLTTASQWAEAQPRSKARGEIMDKLLEEHVKQRGLDSAQAWVTGLPESTFRDGVTRKVAWRLTEQNPADSSRWISALPNTEGKWDAANDLMEQWAGKDPNAAGTWLKQYAPSPETDEPRQTFAWRIREKDRESSLAWAGTITDAGRREKTTIDLLRDWNRQDPGGARSYAQQMNLPEETQRRVFN
ncbi:MAG: hypothetical protein KA004_01615 [Verrucomicrobiales bacterium]|nr:hypothetical protein [Verrucomicrobiales bacterium]